MALAVAACAAAAGMLLGQIACAPAGKPPGKYRVEGPERMDGVEVYTITSAYQETPCAVQVLLPDKFDKARQYKLLYVLPIDKVRRSGRGAVVFDGGIREAQRLDLANKHGIICVEPHFSGMPWFGDNPDNPKVRNDSYLPDVIVPFIDRTFPTVAKPEGRILAGFSKSGIGAVSLLLRHPEVFGRAGSWDAPLMEDHTRTEYYGPQENFMKHYYIPDLLSLRADMLKDQPARIAIAGLGWGDTVKAHQLMEQLKIPHYCDDSLKGRHEWPSGWLEPLVEVLMADDMTKAKPNN
jgi:hypothetical protein